MKRYDVVSGCSCGDTYEYLEEAEGGDWCKYNDVVPELITLRAVADAAAFVVALQERTPDWPDCYEDLRAAIARWKKVKP